MKLTLGIASFAASTLLMGGGVAYSLVADEPTDDTVVTEPTTDEPTTEVPDVEEPAGDDVEGGDTEGEDAEEPAGDEQPGGEEAATEHREAMATWRDCVDTAAQAAADAAAAATEEEPAEPTDVLTLCGTKPHPPGKANGWDGEKVSKNAQKKVDKAVGVQHGKPEKAPKSEKAPKTSHGKSHQH